MDDGNATTFWCTGEMPNGPDDFHRSFVLLFPTEGDLQTYLSSELAASSAGQDVALVRGPNWVLQSNIRDQVAAAVNAGGTIARAGQYWG